MSILPPRSVIPRGGIDCAIARLTFNDVAIIVHTYCSASATRRRRGEARHKAMRIPWRIKRTCLRGMLSLLRYSEYTRLCVLENAAALHFARNRPRCATFDIPLLGAICAAVTEYVIARGAMSHRAVTNSDVNGFNPFPAANSRYIRQLKSVIWCLCVY